MNILTPSTQRVDIRREGKEVLILVNGSLALRMPYEAALKIARGVTAKAKEAEELDNANQLVLDQALMLATGAPFGLTNNPDIMDEAIKEARYDKYLKGFGNIKSESVVGTPAIKHT